MSSASSRLCALLCLLVPLSVAAPAALAAKLPKFTDYPARVYKGPIAKPWPVDVRVRAHIADYEAAASKRTIAAGHYVVVSISCGEDCVAPDVFDARTGRRVDVPFSISGAKNFRDDFVPVMFRPDSRLIMFLGARNFTPPGMHYYVIEKGKLKHLRSVAPETAFDRWVRE